MASYRRRYRRYRRGPTRRRYSRRIGRRQFRGTRVARRRNFRPRQIRPMARPITTIDRTPNFDGDSALCQFKDVQYNVLERTAPATPATNFFTGNLIPGNWFQSSQIPELGDYIDNFNYCRVVKSTLVVEFFNQGPILKDIGITTLPNNVGTPGIPAWTATTTPAEQPRTVSTTVGGSTSSRSVRKLIATGTNLTAYGDKSTMYSAAADLDTSLITTAPPNDWSFYIWQGTGQAGATAAEVGTGVQYRATTYRTVKFFARKIQTN